MKKQIFSVVPLGKKMQQGKALYGVQLRLNGLEKTQQIWKTIPEYCSLQKQIVEIAFDSEPVLDSQVGKASDEQKLKLIVDFVNQCKTRPDITNLITFRQFFNLTQAQFQYLDEWNRVNVAVKQMAIVGLAWDASLGLLITLHRPHTKAKIITNFFKQLLSKQTQSGMIRFHSLTHKWNALTQIQLQSEPIQLQWKPKSKMLIVSTSIGIHIYTVSKMGETFKNQLIDFVKIYNPRDFRFAQKSAHLYVATSQKLYLHSINKQFTMQINSQNYDHINAIDINKSETRLYCAENQSIKIFDISQIKQTKQLANIVIADTYIKLQSCAQKYLFGVSKAGYITVFQIKPVGKQRLMSALTNIDSPSGNSLFAFSEKNQMIITSNGRYIVLISTKNVPLFAGGTHQENITTGIFYQEGNLIITADIAGNVVFSNLNFKIGSEE